MIKRTSRTYSQIGTHSLTYKRHNRDVKPSETAESAEQPNSPFLCWVRILFCPIIFPLLMLYELIFLEDDDDSVVASEEDDESEPSKIGEMMQMASVASLTAAASVSSMITQAGSSRSMPGGPPGQLGRALSRKDLKKEKKELPGALFGTSSSHGISMRNLPSSPSSAHLAIKIKREVYVPSVNVGRTDRALPVDADAPEVKVVAPPSRAGAGIVHPAMAASTPPTSVITPQPMLAVGATAAPAPASASATPASPVPPGRPPVASKLSLPLGGRHSPKVSPAPSPKHSPRGSIKGAISDRSESDSTMQSRSSSGKSNKGDLLSIVESREERGEQKQRQWGREEGKEQGQSNAGKPPLKGTKTQVTDKSDIDLLDGAMAGVNHSRSSSGKSNKGDLLSIVESNQERIQSDTDLSSGKLQKAKKFPVMEKLELDAIDGCISITPRSRASSRRPSVGELLVIVEGDDSNFDKMDDRDRDRERVERLPQKDDSQLPSLADRKKLRAELLAIMEGDNDEVDAPDREDLSPRSDSEDYDRDRDRGHTGSTPRIQYGGRTYTKGELLVILEDDTSEMDSSEDKRVGGSGDRDKGRERERDRDRRAVAMEPRPEDISVDHRRTSLSKVDLLTIVEGDTELDGKNDYDNDSVSSSPRAPLSARLRSGDSQDSDWDIRDGVPVSVHQRQHRHSKGDLLVIFEDKDESESGAVKNPGRDRNKDMDRIALQETLERKRLRAELLAIIEGVDDDGGGDGDYSPRSDSADLDSMDGLASGTPRLRSKHTSARADLLVIVEEEGDKEVDRGEDEVAPSPRSARNMSRNSSIDLGLDRITEDEVADLDTTNLFQELHVEPKTRMDVSSQSGHGLACILEDHLDDPEDEWEGEEEEDGGLELPKLTSAAIAAHTSRTSPDRLVGAGSPPQGTPPKAKSARAQSAGVRAEGAGSLSGSGKSQLLTKVQGPRIFDVQVQQELVEAQQQQQQVQQMGYVRPSSAPVRESVQVGSALDDDDAPAGIGNNFSRGTFQALAGPRPTSGKVQLVSKKKAVAMGTNLFNSSGGPGGGFLLAGGEQDGFSPEKQPQQQQFYQSPQPGYQQGPYLQQQFHQGPPSQYQQQFGSPQQLPYYQQQQYAPPRQYAASQQQYHHQQYQLQQPYQQSQYVPPQQQQYQQQPTQYAAQVQQLQQAPRSGSALGPISNSNLMSYSMGVMSSISSSLKDQPPNLKRISLKGRQDRAWSGIDLKEAQKVIRQVTRTQLNSLAQVVPWFLGTMPTSYFRAVDKDVRNQHLVAACALYTFQPTEMHIKLNHSQSADSTMKEMSFVTSGYRITDADDILAGVHETIDPRGHHGQAELTGIQVYTSADELMSVSMVSCSMPSHDDHLSTSTAPLEPPGLTKDPSETKVKEEASVSNPLDMDIRFSPAPLSAGDGAELEFELMKQQDAMGDQELQAMETELFDIVRENELTAVRVAPAAGRPLSTWVTVAMANVLPEASLKRLLHFFAASKLPVSRVFVRRQHAMLPEPLPALDWVNNVALLRVELRGKLSKATRAAIVGPLQRLRWLGDDVIELGLIKFPFLGVNRAEVILALCSMMHGPLHKQNPRSFVSPAATMKILESDVSFVRTAAHIADLFFEKFAIDLEEANDDDSRCRYQEHRTAYMEQLWRSESSSAHASGAITVLTSMLRAVNAVARTNFHHADRYALSFIIDPAAMMSDDHVSITTTGSEGKLKPRGGSTPGGYINTPPVSRPVPFCVYYCFGREFTAFHCRFSNIARGGMRVVTPANATAHALESSKHFDEVYNLAYAQQLKNKDIPAGGAKAVVLVRTCGDEDSGATSTTAAEHKFNAIRRSVRAFSDSMLDLVIGASVSNMVDFWRGEEQLFFGPDEQVVSGDVDWITHRATLRGYRTPSTIMTSKAAAGINHKQYGVTSEGVIVYLDAAVRELLGVDPQRKPFTVKITGGPDGDVAGNLMKFLVRDYPQTARIVGVADGFGVAEDPDGLDHGELMRLVEASASIDSFDRSKLGPKGCVMDVTTAEGARRRNHMAFAVPADVFVPGGGRPGTINKHNWRRFLSADGTRSAKLIVEGANLFITGEGRRLLYGAGVAIVKDSSANKGGVIASSFEVQALMVLSTDEFIRQKEQIVGQVREKIRSTAAAEAKLLLLEYGRDKQRRSLPELSEAISRAINHVKLLMENSLRDLADDDPALTEVLALARDDSLLPVVAATVGVDWVALPNSRSLAASALASRFVYDEGIGATERIPENHIFAVVTGHFRSFVELQQFSELLAQVPASCISAEERRVVVGALAAGGTRAAVERDMARAKRTSAFL